MASRFRHRRRPWISNSVAAQIRTGKSSLAGHALSQRSSRDDREGYRKQSGGLYQATSAACCRSAGDTSAQIVLFWFFIFSHAWKVPATEYTWSGADGGAILPLQFCLFHIWPNFSAFLSRA